MTRNEIIKLCDKKIKMYKNNYDLESVKGWEITKKHFETKTETKFEAVIFGLIEK